MTESVVTTIGAVRTTEGRGEGIIGRPLNGCNVGREKGCLVGWDDGFRVVSVVGLNVGKRC